MYISKPILMLLINIVPVCPAVEVPLEVAKTLPSLLLPRGRFQADCTPSCGFAYQQRPTGSIALRCV